MVQSPDLGDFFSYWHKGRKGNPVASSGCFSASNPTTSSSHHSPFPSKTEFVQSDTTNEHENLTILEESQKNQKLLPNIACICKRYQVSD